jgi:hypothetical protein
LTFRGSSNIKDSSKATSFRELDCQHLTSSKLAPSLDVKTFTSPGEYAQFTFTPKATRRECKMPVQVTPQRRGHGKTRTTNKPARASRKRIMQLHIPRSLCFATHACAIKHLSTVLCPTEWLPLEHLTANTNSTKTWIPTHSFQKRFANIQNHQKVLAVRRRRENQLNCPLNKCCWRWQHQTLHIAVLQLPEAPAEMTRCTTAALCCAAWVGPDRISTRNDHPTLIQPYSKAELCSESGGETHSKLDSFGKKAIRSCVKHGKIPWWT